MDRLIALTSAAVALFGATAAVFVFAGFPEGVTVGTIALVMFVGLAEETKPPSR